jgi:hypothetical protein
VIPPGLGHALLALAIQGAHAGVTVAVFGKGLTGLWVGAASAIWFYIGRERRQSEEHFGSNRVAPWRWKPRALRDAAWPALAVLAVAGAATFAWGAP